MIKQTKLCVGGTWDGEEHSLPFYPRIELPCKTGNPHVAEWKDADAESVREHMKLTLKTEQYDMLTLSDSGYYLGFYKARGLSDMQALALLVDGYRKPKEGTRV